MTGLPKSGNDERRSQPQNFLRLIRPSLTVGSQTGFSTTRGMVYLQPFEIIQRMTISKVFFPINSGTGTCRFALYADAGDTPLGGTKAWDSGNIGAATIT